MKNKSWIHLYTKRYFLVIFVHNRYIKYITLTYLNDNCVIKSHKVSNINIWKMKTLFNLILINSKLRLVNLTILYICIL